MIKNIRLIWDTIVIELTKRIRVIRVIRETKVIRVITVIRVIRVNKGIRAFM